MKKLFSNSSLASMLLTIMVLSSNQPFHIITQNPIQALSNEFKSSEQRLKDEVDFEDVVTKEEV